MKKIINRIFGLLGYQIRATHVPLQSFEEGMRQIAKNFNIDIVVDIGVAHHTNDLYQAFVGKQFLLIEANPAFRENLEKLKKQLHAKIEMVFCGEKSGETTLNVPKNNRRASAYTTKNSEHESITVKTETLDNLMARNGLLSGNTLLKIDVEGAELDVLKGAKKTLLQTKILVLEICWGVPFTPKASDYTDVLLFVKNLGFKLNNIVEGGGILRHGRLTHADFIFVKN